MMSPFIFVLNLKTKPGFVFFFFFRCILQPLDGSGDMLGSSPESITSKPNNLNCYLFLTSKSKTARAFC